MKADKVREMSSEELTAKERELSEQLYDALEPRR